MNQRVAERLSGLVNETLLPAVRRVRGREMGEGIIA